MLFKMPEQMRSHHKWCEKLYKFNFDRRKLTENIIIIEMIGGRKCEKGREKDWGLIKNRFQH